MIAVISGGVGAAKFLRGLAAVVDPDKIAAVVNVADDFDLHGLRICPDLDTVRSTLAGDVGEQGWGRANESWTAMAELARLAAFAPQGSRASDWFSLGDKDLAIHLYRSQRLTEGASLYDITRELCVSHDVEVNVLPASENKISTQILTDEHGWIDFQHYFVALAHKPPVQAVKFEGITSAKPGIGVLETLQTASQIVIAPSNPFVSIAPVMEIPGVGELIQARRSDVVAISPIVAGEALKGPAAQMFAATGMEPSAAAVAQIWAPYCSKFVIDDLDESLFDSVSSLDLKPIVTNTVMKDLQASSELARVVVGH